MGHLEVEIFNLQISYTRCVGRLTGWAGGGGIGSRCFNSGYHDPELLQVDFSSLFMYTFYAKSML